MAKIYVNFRTGNAVSGVWSYNDFSSVTAIGVVSADLKDDTNTSTGVGLSIATNPFTAASGTGSNATAGVGEFTEEVLDYYNSFPIGSPPDLVFTGLPASTSVSFTAAGYQSGQASRDTTYTIGGNSATYDNDAPASAPNPAVTVTGTTDGSGGLTVNLSGVSSFARINGFILEYTEASSASIDVDIPSDINLKWDTTHQLAVTHDGGTTTLDNVTLSAPSGWETVTFTTAPDEATTESFYEKAKTDATLGGGGYTMIAGDVLAWTTSTGLTIDGQTIPVVDPAATVTGSYKIWDDTLETWSSTSTYTITDNGIYTGEPANDVTAIVQPMISNMIKDMVN